jgi:hypothetical protein
LSLKLLRHNHQIGIATILILYSRGFDYFQATAIYGFGQILFFMKIDEKGRAVARAWTL